MKRRRALDALALFDALHAAPSWRPWRAFVAALTGSPLAGADLELFRQCTGRREPRAGGYPEAAVVVGVQSGKTRTAGTLAALAALGAPPGTYALLVGQDHRGAMRALLAAARAPFSAAPALRAELARESADTLELRSGATIAAYPCRPAAIRGLRASIVCIDELAFFTATDGRPTDVEMLRAARGRVATTGGRVVILSSPYAQTGALYDLHRRHFGREDSPVLVWQASAATMNPTLSADYLSRMERDDPEAHRSEVLGEFRAGIAQFLDPDAIAACVEPGVREREPVAGVSYFAFADAASGSGKDSFACAIAHRDGARAVLDAVRAWAPPFNPSGVCAEAADLARRYGCRRVFGDRYAPGFVAEAFRRAGVEYGAAPRSTSDGYLELLPHVNAGAVLLLDDPALLRELRGLERRRGAAGRDRVDHRPGAHDDRACAAAGALVLASARRRESLLVWGSDGRESREQTLARRQRRDDEAKSLREHAAERRLWAATMRERLERERSADDRLSVPLRVVPCEPAPSPVFGGAYFDPLRGGGGRDRW